MSAAAGPGGTLYVVATPIGNLGDVSGRALDVLRAVPLIAAEDTRITRRLLLRYQITTRQVSYHARNAAGREPELLAHLRGGADLAVVTDAGTPLVSDPGSSLVAAWAGEGGRVVPIPGASAVLAALVASGLPAARWGFEGFLPRRGRERRERLARVADDDRATVLFEAPEPVGRDPARPGRRVRRGPASGAGPRTDQAPRGDLARRPGGAGGASRGRAAARRGDHRGGRSSGGDGAGRARGRVTWTWVARRWPGSSRAGLSRSEAARRVAARTGLPRRELFREG